MKAHVPTRILRIQICIVLLVSFGTSHSQILDETFDVPRVVRMANVQEIIELPDESLLLQGDIDFYKERSAVRQLMKK